MDKISILQRALNDFCSQVLEDTTFLTHSFKNIHQKKQEFGLGYALINVGIFNPDENEFIHPHPSGVDTVWLDESTTNQYLNHEIATNILNFINQPSPDNHEAFVFMGSIDHGDTVKEGRYSVATMNFYVADHYCIKPSSITSQQISKRLRRMVSSGVRLLVLDTSHPDFMGNNLAKWLREIKQLRKHTSQNFNVVVDASDEFPAQLPPDLSDYLPIRISK